MPNEKSGSTRGFASMDQQKQRDISKKGGESVAPEHRSFSKDRTLASAAGRKGAESRNANRQREAALRAAQQRGAPDSHVSNHDEVDHGMAASADSESDAQDSLSRPASITGGDDE